MRDPLGVAQELVDEYGGIVGVKTGPVKALLLAEPDAIAEALGPRSSVLRKDRRYRSTPRLLGEGLLTSSGELWRRQRRLMQPAFHQEYLRRYADLMAIEVEREVDKLEGETNVDINQWMMRATLGIAGRALFGIDIDQQDERFLPAFEVLLEHWNRRATSVFPLPEGIPTPRQRRFMSAVRLLEALLEELIESRRRSGNLGTDLLGLLLSALDDFNDPAALRQVRDEFVTMILAGYETSANAMTWLMWLLDRNPAVQSRLVQELEEVLGGRAIRFDELGSAPYLGAAIQEALRLYPPVWGFGREVIEDTEIGGFRVDRGTQVLVSPYLMHRTAKYFPEPTRYDPERWLDERAKSIPLHAFIPFGRGPRMCIGKSFATTEAAVIASVLLPRFRMVPLEDHVRPVPAITLRPQGGLRMRIEPRRAHDQTAAAMWSRAPAEKTAAQT